MTEKQPEDISQTASNLFLSTFMGAQRTEAPVVRSTLSKMVVVTMASNNIQEETRGNLSSSLKCSHKSVLGECLNHRNSNFLFQDQSELRARGHQTGA